ncbi:MAG: CrcB family protein [Micrococcales bacterium]|nr:CrcB family protein [Micrococcales bacterium]
MSATPASASDDEFAELPLDPDVEVAEAPPGPPAPVHLRPAYLGVVFAGGAVGTAAREGLGLLIPPTGGVPWAILAANLAGAFLLGVLLEALVRRGPDHGIRRTLRLLLGTGFMGGFTTYSALATDTASLFGAGHGWLGAAYALGTVVVGALATTAGILLAAAAHRARFGGTSEAAG